MGNYQREFKRVMEVSLTGSMLLMRKFLVSTTSGDVVHALRKETKQLVHTIPRKYP